MQNVQSASAPSQRHATRQRRERQQSPQSERKAPRAKKPSTKTKEPQDGKKLQAARAVQLLSSPGASVASPIAGSFAAESPVQAAVETFRGMGEQMAGALGAIGSRFAAPFHAEDGSVNASSGDEPQGQPVSVKHKNLSDSDLTPNEIRMGKSDYRSERKGVSHRKVLTLKRILFEKGISLGNRLSFNFKNSGQAGISLMAGREGDIDQQLTWERKRLRGLGLAAVSLWLRERLLERYPEANPKQLTQMEISLLNKKTLADKATNLGFPSLFILKREDEWRRTFTPSLAGSLLSALGAVYWQGGLESVKTISDRIFGEAVSKAGNAVEFTPRSYPELREVSADLRRERALKLQELLGLQNIDTELLAVALNYRWHGVTNSVEDTFQSDRLEFLGDVVLGLGLAKELREKYRNENSQPFAVHLEKADTQAEVARDFGIDKLVLAPEGAGPLENKATSDVLEAIFGAVYLWGGMDAAQPLIRRLFSKALQYAPMDAALRIAGRSNKSRFGVLSESDFDDSV